MDLVITKLIKESPENFANLEPEQLAGFVMQDLHLRFNKDDPDGPGFHKHNETKPTKTNTLADIEPRELRYKASRALMEAWSWLEHEGLLASTPGDASQYYITKKGWRLKRPADMAAFLKARILPKELLHPPIADKILSLFLRGDYDIAVLQAFKEVEVAVRLTANLSDEDIGINLMRDAFKEEIGPLTDTSIPTAEQQSLSHLFAGAIGYYKNPQSHRKHPIKADEAAEIIIMACHLLRIVDTRRFAKNPPERL